MAFSSDFSLPAAGQNDRGSERGEHAEEQLQLQSTILRHISDGVIATDLHGYITYWNEGAGAIFGYTAEEMLGETPALLYPGRDIEQAVQDLKDVLAGFEYLGEWEGRRKDGTTVWVDLKTTVMRDMQGQPVGLIGIVKDITERKKLAEEANRAKEQLEAILQNVVDGITVVDANDRLVYVNDVIARGYGFSSATAMADSLNKGMWHRHDEWTVWDERGRLVPASERPAVQALRGKQAKALLRYQHNTTGKVYWNLVHAQPIFDTQRQVQFVVSVYTDLTELKELEQRKDHFISMAGHELKTPLTVLSAYTQLLKEQFEAEGRQDIVLTLSKMDIQITNLIRLVVDLLDISSMQAGQLEMAREMVDMGELVREVVESLQPTTTHRLLIEGAADQPVPGDRGRLEQVLIILLINAIKYSPDADKIIVRIVHGAGKLMVSVQDFGIGIAQKHHLKIFDRFYRVLSEKDQTFPGLGIGLYIAREIIERQGGQMWVESVEGKGSTFFFSLPAQALSEDAASVDLLLGEL